jgi:hypothetical protein
MIVFGQGFSYTFTDPCTFKSKELFINNPNGNVALMYYGNVQSFTASELQSGALEQWINQINSSNPTGSGPCGGVAIVQNTTLNALIASNNISVLTNVMSTMSSLSSMVTTSGGGTIQGVVQSNEKVSSNNKKEDDKNKPNQGSSTNGTTNGGSNQSTTPNGNSGGSNGGSQGTNSQSTNGTTNGNSNQTQNNGTTNNNGGSSTSSESNQTNSQSQTNNGNSSNVGGGNSSQGSTTTTQGGGSTGSGSSSQGGSTTTQSSVGGNSSSNNNDPKSNEEKVGEMNKTATSNSTQVKAKVATVKQGSLMMTGDLVVISSASGSDKQQIKVNKSIIKSNTENTFAKGGLLNYTSSINNSCLTLFAAYRYKNLTSIIANSSMMNFERDFFNTTSVMESYKVWKITGTLGVNYSIGNLGDAKFRSVSCLGGLVGNFNVSKKISATTMFVMVYSPYVYFYEGLWYKSGLLAVPFVAADYRITQKFKLNISFSGVQQIQDATLNYQVLLGAKALL